MEREQDKEMSLAYDLVGKATENDYPKRPGRMRGLLVTEAAKELGVSNRTVYRMIRDGKLKAERWDAPYGYKSFYYLIDPVSIAKLILMKEATGKQRYRFDKENKEEKKDE